MGISHARPTLSRLIFFFNGIRMINILKKQSGFWIGVTRPIPERMVED